MILYTPSTDRIQNNQMTRFQNYYQKKIGQTFSSYQAFHAHTVREAPFFWNSLFHFFKPLYSGSLEPNHTSREFFPYPWFPQVKMNFAENLLMPHGDIQKSDEQIALSSAMENRPLRHMTYGELKNKVAQFQAYLKKKNFKRGDVLAAYMPNTPETIIAMLATTSLGGIFTSTSCDFGASSVVDRFEQVSPKILVTVSEYSYNGKIFSLQEKVKEIVKGLPSVTSVVVIDQENFDESVPSKLDFEKMNFSDPVYIMYSSGTTGKPKCIVHSIGGTLLQHIKEIGLHSDLNEKKKILFFTTCGWMMWNWLASSLYFGAQIYLYEGSPNFPNFHSFLKLINDEAIQIWGTSPKYLKALELSGENCHFPFLHLETILSTGSPLLPEQYDFVYSKIKKENLQLSSISGGTDILGCFMLGNPNLSVTRGEIQCLGLGMDVQEKEGELICAQNFISTPIYFWNDPKFEKYHAAYFSRFPGVWCHGDFIRISREGTVQVLGRSDATLNPGGVRIGTAEIYRQTEKLSFISDSLCVGKVVDGDEYVVLFVKMNNNEKLSEEKINEIKKSIKENLSPRHVPWKIVEVKGIPYTRSGKKMELLINRILAGKKVDNLEVVQNPECIEEYQKLSSNFY